MPKPDEIRRVRLHAHLTQSEAAEILGVTRVAWARYESTAASSARMHKADWEYFKHKAGIERIPFRKRSQNLK